MEKRKTIIFAAFAILGVFVSVCTADGSAHEIAMRLGGTVAFAIGTLGWSLTCKEGKEAGQ